MEEKKARLQHENLENVAGGTDPMFYTVTCARCGKDFPMPFPPKENTPVFCKECFEAERKK